MLSSCLPKGVFKERQLIRNAAKDVGMMIEISTFLPERELKGPVCCDKYVRRVQRYQRRS